MGGPHSKAWACELGVAPAREAGTSAGAHPRDGVLPLGQQKPEKLVHVRRRFRSPHVGCSITARALHEKAEIAAECCLHGARVPCEVRAWEARRLI